ncbi:DegT/DnrJ/EryC1/StrS family aminotransferase [Hymenobacter ginsengisoli]|uniref:DegT/DnrJ/EryC1/StrS family aminotransferase n=1 Tax=Hymenobacter ginsengisoli TaxID=1051626 RepID=A0ABP8Q0Q0_9BACT|nr:MULTISPECIES: DegT/DnrJ/EryC1/StrS family aminotransferase [unclassified Hymenobacter]MBO2033723.1 DegT/DnrJ/EryC1/StrS family aminotransferase [Hymenobacter sp. BT559]
MRIPFLSLAGQHEAIKDEVLGALANVYDRQSFVLGEQVAAFEREYSQVSGVAYTVGVGNGLDALHLSLRALGLQPGDEVLVPSNTYIATWLAVSLAGGVPVPVEPDWRTSNLDAAQLAAAITSRTRGIIPVHLYGQPCDMSAILALAARHSLWVMEDNAQAQGASWHGQPTGSFGQVNATSFYPSKNLGALGDGGAITTNDAVLAHTVRQLRNYGTERRYVSETIGYNSRLDELQAAVLRVKLHHLPEWTRQRRELADRYTAYLADIPGLRLPFVVAGATPVWHLYVVHTPWRDALQQHLAAAGIESLVHYPVPPHLQPAYAGLGLPAGAFPIAEELATTCLSLPLWPGMTEAMIENVATVIKDFYHHQ